MVSEAISTPECVEEAGEQAITTANALLQLKLDEAGDVAELQAALFAEQIADRTAAFHQALIHLTNCANGRASISSGGSGDAKPLNTDDAVVSATFAYPAVLPTPSPSTVHVAAASRGQ